MRQEFINMHQEWSKITAECQDMDALIKDMRATSFSVRLSIQEMDQQFDSQSLADTTTAVTEQRYRLMELCREAEGTFLCCCQKAFNLQRFYRLFATTGRYSICRERKR